MTPKYRNRRTGKYDSKKEAARAAELQLLAKIGKIEDLVEQPEYVLIPKQQGERAIKYKADFQFFDKELGKTIVEDVKSAFTRKLPVYRMKKKLMKYMLGIEVVEI